MVSACCEACQSQLDLPMLASLEIRYIANTHEKQCGTWKWKICLPFLNPASRHVSIVDRSIANILNSV